MQLNPNNTIKLFNFRTNFRWQEISFMSAVIFNEAGLILHEDVPHVFWGKLLGLRCYAVFQMPHASESHKCNGDMGFDPLRRPMVNRPDFQVVLLNPEAFFHLPQAAIMAN